MRPVLIASALALAIAAGGCKVSTVPDNGSSEAAAAQGDWPGFVNNFIEASFKANPGFAVVQGRHEYDGQISDLSAASIQGEVDRLKKAIAEDRKAGLRFLTGGDRPRGIELFKDEGDAPLLGEGDGTGAISNRKEIEGRR